MNRPLIVLLAPRYVLGRDRAKSVVDAPHAAETTDPAPSAGTIAQKVRPRGGITRNPLIEESARLCAGGGRSGASRAPTESPQVPVPRGGGTASTEIATREKFAVTLPAESHLVCAVPQKLEDPPATTNRDVLFELRVSRTKMQRLTCTVAAALVGAVVWLYPDVTTPIAIALTALVAFRRALV